MNTHVEGRRALRRNATEAERALWFHLRTKRLAGFRFRRQHPCGPYVLDFYCPARRLAVELDGGQHLDTALKAQDDQRTVFLRRQGIDVLRFAKDAVLREIDQVLHTIALVLGVIDPSL